MVDDKLSPFGDFGTNPGALRASTYIPENLPERAPLVVVLHGCTQTSGAYDRSSGWSNAADEHGFALLFPEQQRTNNPNLCFNWFSPEDATRGHGEALSIRQMISAMHSRHGTDPQRVFVTGLSAGGAMAAVMLATYPELFAGGAIIAGVPFGAARSVPEAFERMRGNGHPAPDALAERVRSASGHSGPWPIMSIWHGTSDAVVDQSNAAAIVDQWREVHGASEAPSRTDEVNGYPHRVWKDARGREVVEEYVITGMGHGTPLCASGHSGEVPAPFMLEAGISSTRQIARFWGLDKEPGAKRQLQRKSVQPADIEPEPDAPPKSGLPLDAPMTDLQKTIEDALRAAGLMR